MDKIIIFFTCFAIPIGGFVHLNKTGHRKWLPFVIGVMTFVVSQVLIRIPLLQIMTMLPQLQAYFSANALLYILLLSLSAGLFEEGARYIGLSFLRDHRSLNDAILLGLGHGGVEAILLVGIPALSQGLSVYNASLAGMERVFAILAHICFSIIIAYGIQHHNGLIYTGIAILAHTLFNLIPTVLFSMLTIPSIIGEIIIGLLTLLIVSITYYAIIKKGRYY